MKSSSLPLLIMLICLSASLRVAADQEGMNVYDSAVQIRSLLQADVTNIGQPIEYPQAGSPEVSIVKVIIPPGVETGWHKHPVNGFAVILQGELNIKRRDGQSMTYRAGDAFAEMVNEVHRGKSIGEEPVELIMFIIGEKGMPFSVPADG